MAPHQEGCGDGSFENGDSQSLVFRRVGAAGFAAPLVASTIDRLVGVTIGNFDGLHLGHQALFAVLHERLRVLSGSRQKAEVYPVLFTFHPHPRNVLLKLRGASAVTETLPVSSLRAKVTQAAENGFRLCVSAHFTKAFAALTPEDFAERFIVQGLGAKLVVVGHDWAFGRGRSGSVDVLREIGEKRGFEVVVVPPVEVDGVRVSTTLLREALARGDMKSARALLGRRYSIADRVRHGERRGTQLGFQTANLEPPGVLLPANGVYAGWARVGGAVLPAVANLGVRPTFGEGRRVLEVHLLDGLQSTTRVDLYGERLELEFEDRIRDERRFSGVVDLK